MSKRKPLTDEAKMYRLLSAATTNGNLIEAGAKSLLGIHINNTNAAARFVKLYNKATAPTVGTDTPVMTIPVAATNGVVRLEFVQGVQFSLGLGIGITGAVTDADTTAVTANDTVVNIQYL